MTPSDADVGLRVRLARIKRGLTQRELGALMGVSHVAVGDIERGKTHITLRLLDTLATHLETTPAELTSGAVATIPHEHYWTPGGFYPGTMTVTGAQLVPGFQVIVCHCSAVKVVVL